jgi:hypothetical protein
LQIQFEGKTYDFDPETDIKLAQLDVLEKTIGVGFVDIVRGAEKGIASGLRGFVWCMRVHAGEAPGDPRKLDFDVAALYEALAEAIKAESDAKADPTTSAPATPATPEPMTSLPASAPDAMLEQHSPPADQAAATDSILAPEIGSAS